MRTRSACARGQAKPPAPPSKALYSSGWRKRFRLRLLFLAVACAAAQNQTAPVTLRTTTTLVQLSVVAHDANGNAVKDLKKEDFQVFDNGKEQEIAVFSPQAAVSASPVPLPNPAEDNTKPTDKPHGNALILLDYLNSGLLPAARARGEIIAFLKNFDPEGKIALWVLDDSGLKRVGDFGTDRDALLKGMDSVNGKPAMCNDNGFGGPFCPPTMADVFLLEREIRTIAALDSLSNQLSGLAGRKALIWVSTSTDAEGAIARTGWPRDLPHVNAEKERVLHKMNWADIALYPVGACGLVAGSPCNSHVEAMDDFAAQTGGVATHGLNRLDISMQNAVEDVQFVYSMAFYPTDSGARTDFHKLKVQVKRPGVKLEYKQGYSIDPPSGAPPEIPGALARAAALAAAEAANAETSATPAPTAPPAKPEEAAPTAKPVENLPTAPAPEITTRETPVTFRSRVNLVTAPVVVRDSKKSAVDNLEKEDFQLFDGGKPQIVSRFTVERPTAPPPPTAPEASPAAAGAAPAPAPLAMPQRYVAMVIDDLHTEFADLVWARQAAQRFLDSSTESSQRVAFYTTSGQNNVDFTNDRDLLNKTLLAIRSGVKSTLECPSITYYAADQIVNRDNSGLLSVMESELRACQHQSYSAAEAETLVKNAAERVLMEGDWNTRQALATLRAVIDKLATMPGRRSLVLISDGFLLLDEHRPEEMSLFESAIRANVVINSLGAAGLKAYPPGGDASRSGAMTSGAQMAKMQYDQAGDEAAAAVLEESASGTGGRYFHNSNDMDEGMRLLAGAPEAIYLLGFAPQNLKFDGRYHTLKVTLRNPKGLTVEARAGYYAPNRAADPAEQSKEEIQAAFFSTEEIREIPATMETQFFKTGPDGATVDILARVDVKQLNFKQEDGRNRNDVTVVSGLFDENGNYVSGIQKVLEMRLLDETLATRLAQGIAVRSSIKTKPGRYLVRVVVRDAQGQELTALSKAVEIP
jgi:VWFA-related protein